MKNKHTQTQTGPCTYKSAVADKIMGFADSDTFFLYHNNRELSEKKISSEQERKRERERVREREREEGRGGAGAGENCIYNRKRVNSKGV